MVFSAPEIFLKNSSSNNLKKKEIQIYKLHLNLYTSLFTLTFIFHVVIPFNLKKNTIIDICGDKAKLYHNDENSKYNAFCRKLNSRSLTHTCIYLWS